MSYGPVTPENTTIYVVPDEQDNVVEVFFALSQSGSISAYVWLDPGTSGDYVFLYSYKVPVARTADSQRRHPGQRQ